MVGVLGLEPLPLCTPNTWWGWWGVDPLSAASLSHAYPCEDMGLSTECQEPPCPQASSQHKLPEFLGSALPWQPGARVPEWGCRSWGLSLNSLAVPIWDLASSSFHVRHLEGQRGSGIERDISYRNAENAASSRKQRRFTFLCFSVARHRCGQTATVGGAASP